MRVALIAPPWLPVPPPSYGGTETVIDGLARGLAAAGHDVQLVAHPASTCPVPVQRVDSAVHEVAMGDVTRELHHVIQAYAGLGDVDVVHDHTLAGAVHAAAIDTGPVVVTHHGPFDARARTIFRSIVERGSTVVGISHDQVRRAPVACPVVHHGIDAAQFPVGDGAGGHLLFLGRMAPQKGVHVAAGAARRRGERLLIAAKCREPAEHEYFERAVAPLLGDGVEYVGEVDFETKVELLASARALVNPIGWPEPFGMVMVEALACGTPVIGYPSGAAPEIVEHGRTGFLVDGDDELVAALGRIGELDRDACRRRVVEHFSLEHMVEGYVDVYDRVLSARSPSLLV